VKVKVKVRNRMGRDAVVARMGMGRKTNLHLNLHLNSKTFKIY